MQQRQCLTYEANYYSDVNQIFAPRHCSTCDGRICSSGSVYYYNKILWPSSNTGSYYQPRINYWGWVRFNSPAVFTTALELFGPQTEIIIDKVVMFVFSVQHKPLRFQGLFLVHLAEGRVSDVGVGGLNRP